MGLFRLVIKALFVSRRPTTPRIKPDALLGRDGASRPERVANARQRVRVDYAEASVVAITRARENPAHAVLKGRCYVIDGDTIVIGDVRIRIAGIDAPELDHPWGKKSKWTVVNMCKGEIVTAHIHGEMSYGRVVATCYLRDGRDIAEELVKCGLALDWPKFSGGKYRHLEPPDARRKLWRADARQKGRMPV